VPKTQQPEEKEIEQQSEEKNMKFLGKLRFPQNLGVHPNPPNMPKKIPYLQKEEPDQTKKDPAFQKKTDRSS